MRSEKEIRKWIAILERSAERYFDLRMHAEWLMHMEKARVLKWVLEED